MAPLKREQHCVGFGGDADGPERLAAGYHDQENVRPGRNSPSRRQRRTSMERQLSTVGPFLLPRWRLRSKPLVGFAPLVLINSSAPEFFEAHARTRA